MNFYKRYMGDYGRDTAHLSLAEHGAYTLLLDHYYSTEQPLPADPAALFRICRAFDKLEQRAVLSVADAFFPKSEDGLRHNARADMEVKSWVFQRERIEDLRSREAYRQFREEVIGRHGSSCHYCGASGVPLQLDHVVARSRGGSDLPDNLVPACKPCNTSKGAKSVEEWLR